MQNLGTAHLKEIKQVINEGGYVKFVHSTCSATLVYASGQNYAGIDGRSYHAFLRTVAGNLERIETGSFKNDNLSIIWLKGVN